MALSSTSLERIRDTSVRSSLGFSFDIGHILSEIYKDDVMQPKPQAKLKQQDFTIKSWF